jgi:excisionase family DNA binding protein
LASAERLSISICEIPSFLENLLGGEKKKAVCQMTTQQAADFLNVSRPFLVNEILDKGKVPYRRLGTHRRLLFKDLLEYKNQTEKASREAFRELTEQAQELGFGY